MSKINNPCKITLYGKKDNMDKAYISVLSPTDSARLIFVWSLRNSSSPYSLSWVKDFVEKMIVEFPEDRSTYTKQVALTFKEMEDLDKISFGCTEPI